MKNTRSATANKYFFKDGIIKKKSKVLKMYIFFLINLHNFIYIGFLDLNFKVFN